MTDDSIPLQRGFAVIISAPSGTGKSTVCRKLLQRDRALRYSISCTTRPSRPGEKEGRDYFYLDVEDFKRKIHRHEFVEWALVHDHYYGTPKRYLEEQLEAGRVVILDLDVQGAQAVRSKRADTVTIFLAPPSWRSLEERLQQRRQDAREVVRKRLLNAPGELHKAKHYDYLVVNDDLDQAVEHIESILTAEKLRTARRDLSSLGLAGLTDGRRS